MAIIELTLHNLSHYDENGDEQNTNISISTEQKAPNVILSIGDTNNTKMKFDLSLVDFGFKKKMYQPTEIFAEILIRRSDQKDTTTIKRKQIETIFKHLQVSMSSDGTSIGDDYYVHEVMPHYQTDYMYATLKIYSLDKLLALRKSCHAYTAKKLTTILKEELDNYKTPYKVTSSDGTTGQIPITAKTANMKVLKYGSNKTDHIFPYLVQYNESFYDMLARTCNRWGEFLFYENGALNIGYDDSSSNEKALSKCGKYKDIYYFDYGEKELTISKNKSFNLEAANDDQFIGNILKKSPKKVEGLLFSPGEKGDKVAMKTIASFFKNEKNIPTFVANWLFDELWNLATNKSTTAFENADFDSEYFSSTDTEHYNDGKEYNQFTEHGTCFNDNKYRDILAKEEAAGKNAIHIDFDTNYPLLNLGNILTYDEGKFIVVEITCKKITTMKYKIENNVIKEDPTSSFVFEVIATASESPNSTDGKYGNFYPAAIPSGHIRQAAPQIATINNAEDPSDKNQVRVVFPWQYDLNGEDPKKQIGDPTPWLRFATNAAGFSAVGQHYEGDQVLVGFVDGNVERPYVMGGLTTKGSGGSDIIQTTPGSHTFKLTDDSAGLSKFLTGMFLPVWGTASDFFPQMSNLPETKWEASKKLGGGFELSDNYGIYKITGSTDERCINVASPWGEVNINAFTGITISAPNGDITIKGKNVSIEAGNNLSLVSGKNVDYKLWQEKDSKWGTVAQIGQDVAVAVTKKLAEKFTTIIDLSIIRAVAEIVFRPVEGSLTVKSNRFLKLEAGKNSCDYPAYAYNEVNKKKMLDEENKGNILAAVGSSTNFLGKLTNLSLDNGMVTLFSAVKPATETLVQDFKDRYDNCVTAKSEFNNAMIELKKLSNDNKDGCKTFEELKTEFWMEGSYVAWNEDKLGFKANVGVVAESELDDEQKLKNVVAVGKRTKQIGNPSRPIRDIKKNMKTIVTNRITWRKKTLEAANKLRQNICNLMSISQLERKDVHKYFSWYMRTMPKNFKDNFVKAMSKEACASSPIFKFPDDKKDLAGSANSILDIDILKKHTRRLVAYNLLIELGFTKETRKEVNSAAVEEPICNDYNISGTRSLLNDNYWSDYVKSLNGVPPLEKDSKTLGGALRDAATSSLESLKEDFYALKNIRKEKATWGEGKKGRILFATDGKTYEMSENSFNEIVGIEPTILTLSENSAGLDDHQKKKLGAFVSELRKSITKDGF